MCDLASHYVDSPKEQIKNINDYYFNNKKINKLKKYECLSEQLKNIHEQIYKQMKQIKYTDTIIGFREVPDEVSLCINISNCPNRCEGCHSPELWDDIGIELTTEELDKLIKTNTGISCVCFMGGDNNPVKINELAKWIKSNYPELKTCWYSGCKILDENIELENWNFIKLGPYIKSLGGLDGKYTNQVFYEIIPTSYEDKPFEPIYRFKDVTYKFRK